MQPSFSKRKRPQGKRCFECGRRSRILRFLLHCPPAAHSSSSSALRWVPWPSAHSPALTSCSPTGPRASTPAESVSQTPCATLALNSSRYPKDAPLAGVSLAPSCFPFLPFPDTHSPLPSRTLLPLDALLKENHHVFFFFWPLLGPTGTMTTLHHSPSILHVAWTK